MGIRPRRFTLVFLVFATLLIILAVFYLGRPLTQGPGLLLFEAILAKQSDVEDYWKKNGSFREEAPNLVEKYREYGIRISVSPLGLIRGTMENDVIVIELRPLLNGEDISWECYGSPKKDVPDNCNFLGD